MQINLVEKLVSYNYIEIIKCFYKYYINNNSYINMFDHISDVKINYH